jgi:hypothetical protein
MLAPRLIKVACPECGAAMRVDAGASVVTCAYCKKSSFVHWPNRPTRTTTAPDYGHIHVPAKAMRAALAVVLLSVLVPVAIMIVVAVVMILPSAPASAPFVPKGRTATTPGGPSCEMAVACCKAIQPQNAACEGLRIMSEADCAKQIDALSTAAKAMGRSCR